MLAVGAEIWPGGCAGYRYGPRLHRPAPGVEIGGVHRDVRSARLTIDTGLQDRLAELGGEGRFIGVFFVVDLSDELHDPVEEVGHLCVRHDVTVLVDHLELSLELGREGSQDLPRHPGVRPA